MQLQNSSFQNYDGQGPLQQVSDTQTIYVVGSVNRGNGFDKYIAYQIKVQKPKEVVIQRRYSEFFALRQRLIENWPGCWIPVLPPKHLAGNNSLQIINQRIPILSYFLNSLLKLKHLGQSEQVEKFLNPNCGDFRRFCKQNERRKYHLIMEMFRKSFPDIKYEQQRILEVDSSAKQICDNQQQFCKQTKIQLVNLQKELAKLATYEEQYLRGLKNQQNQTFQKLQKLLAEKWNQNDNHGRTELKMVYTQRQSKELSEKVGKLSQFLIANKFRVALNTLNFEILQAGGLLDSIESRRDLLRRYEITSKKILTNKEQINDIKSSKFTLRALFKTNKAQLVRQIQTQNKELELEQSCMQELGFMVNQILIQTTIPKFKQKRIKFWQKGLLINLKVWEHEQELLKAVYNDIVSTVEGNGQI